MIQAHVSIENLDEGFETSLIEVLDAIDGNLNEVAEVVFFEAKNTTAFKDRKPYLRSTIKKRKSKFKDGGYIVFSRDPKAHLVEYGHVAVPPGELPEGRVPAHAFMRPALDKGIRVAVELFRSKK